MLRKTGGNPAQSNLQRERWFLGGNRSRSKLSGRALFALVVIALVACTGLWVFEFQPALAEKEAAQQENQELQKQLDANHTQLQDLLQQKKQADATNIRLQQQLQHSRVVPPVSVVTGSSDLLAVADPQVARSNPKVTKTATTNVANTAAPTTAPTASPTAAPAPVAAAEATAQSRDSAELSEAHPIENWRQWRKTHTGPPEVTLIENMAENTTDDASTVVSDAVAKMVKVCAELFLAGPVVVGKSWGRLSRATIMKYKQIDCDHFLPNAMQLRATAKWRRRTTVTRPFCQNHNLRMADIHMKDTRMDLLELPEVQMNQPHAHNTAWDAKEAIILQNDVAAGLVGIEYVVAAAVACSFGNLTCQLACEIPCIVRNECPRMPKKKQGPCTNRANATDPPWMNDTNQRVLDGWIGTPTSTHIFRGAVHKNSRKVARVLWASEQIWQKITPKHPDWDIVASTARGEAVLLSAHNDLEATFNGLGHPMQRDYTRLFCPPLPFSEKSKQVLATSFVNDGTYKPRKALLMDLSKYINVNHYGSVPFNNAFKGEMSGVLDPKVNYSDFQTRLKNRYALKEGISAHFLFHLAFENSNAAVDWVTEKIFQAYTAGSVPVYFGTDKIADTVPFPDSYIDAREFNSTEDLASYLVYLSHHEKDYNYYLRFKTGTPTMEISPLLKGSKVNAFCAICHKVKEYKQNATAFVE